MGAADDNPILESELQDNYFDASEEDVLYDAYLILYDYGYSHENLAPLGHLIEHTTNYSQASVHSMCEKVIDE
jgi:hypothetical protein